MTEPPTSPLGTFIETARQNSARISGREAARRAGISESRWRQIVQDGKAPARTVVAMALAVNADPAQALHTAGQPASEEVVNALLSEVRQRLDGSRSRTGTGSGLAAEIERVAQLPLPAEEKIRVANALIEMYEERAREPAE
jgi:hypothetical protein